MIILFFVLIKDSYDYKKVRDINRLHFNRRISHVLTLYESALEHYRPEADSDSEIHEASQEAALLLKELERAGPN